MKKIIILFLLLILIISLFGCSSNFSNKTMVCLGDSITSGYGVDVSYPERLKKELGLKKVYNHGIPGSTLTSKGNQDPFVDRYLDMEDADIVSVLFFGNDILHQVELGSIEDNNKDTIYGALNYLINGLKEKYPNSYIFFITPPINESTRQQIEPYVIATREVCKKFDVDVLDLYNEDVDYDSSKDTIDGFHFNQNFIDKKLTPMIANFIKSNYNN